MAERLTFTLTGRDELSRVLNGTADSADRLRLRLAGINADSDGQLRDLRGRFLAADDAARRLGDSTHATRDSVRNLGDEAGKLGEALKANLISLAPAAIPATAALAGAALHLSGQLGATAVAAAAYGLALKGQIAGITDAVEAQQKYDDAVRTSGRNSQEAVKAQVAYQQSLAKLPPETQRAAVAVGLLKDNFQDWSDSLSGDVMKPFNKGIAITNALLPETTGLAKGASTQFDRLLTLVGGAIESPGFDKLNTRFTTFADRTMSHAVDSLTIFMAKADAGEVGHGVSEFMDYARANGPAVWDTLENVGDALINVLRAGSDVGVGMLDVVNALSGVVSAVPPEAIADLLQLAIAIKAVRLAAAGGGAAKAALLAIGTQLMAMRTAAAGATGVLGRATAAIGGLSRGAKVAAAGTGIGLLLITLDALSSKNRAAAPDVDKMTTALGGLGHSGKASGELVRVFGTDLDGLASAADRVAGKASGMDKFNDVMNSIFTLGMGKSNTFKAAKEDIDALDKGLTNLVQSGKADLAAQALKNIYAAQPGAAKELAGELDNYTDALAGQRLEQDLAAQSMGLFGAQAQQVQAKLDAQTKSTDGLRQSIIALNDVNRSALGGMIGFEAAIDAASKAAQKNAGVLTYNNGQLSVGTEKQRAAAQALSDLAAKTDEATSSARESGASWAAVSGIYERGRQQLIANAQQMGLNRNQAKALADQILAAPDKTAFLKGDIADLEAKLADAKEKLKHAPSSKTAKIRGDIADLEKKLADARAELASIHSKTITITTIRRERAEHNTIGRPTKGEGGQSKYARGGRVHRYADGGDVSFFPIGGPVSGPGTATSDSIPAWLSNGEYVIKAAAVDRYGVAMFDALNAERFAGGGVAGFSYTPTAAPGVLRSASDVQSAYSSAHQPISREEYTKKLRAQANAVDTLRTAEARLEQVRKNKHHTHAQLVAAENSVAKARRGVATATDAAKAAEARYRQTFSLSDWGKTLASTVRSNAAYEAALSKIAARGGADVIEQLRGLGAEGAAMVAALAKASNRQFNEIIGNLRKLAPTAAATLADYTRQLNATTSGSKEFQANLLKLASMGFGDLAMQLAGQGDANAMALAAAAVKSSAAAAKANAAVKAGQKLLTADELTAATQLLSVLAGKKGAGVADVVAAGVSWPMLAHLAPLYAKQIKAIPGSGTFVKEMKERGVALAQGGLLWGPGTSTSDSIPVWGSTGEYMVKAAAVAKYGVRFMDALNEGRLPVGRSAIRAGLPAAPPVAAPVAGVDRPAVTYNVYPRASVIGVEDLRLLQRQEEARQRVGRPR
ncbi:hypothetical protein [Streptomyces sp. NPDC056160]|uniref:hypothetical protein n=1 Tax=Streptomyces sp. NPDC056160 TaxID=3345731 RepID=UPI0035DCF995